MERKFAFADALRGIAAISVLISHFAGVFWLSQPVAASLINAPPLQSPTPAFASLLGSVQWGPFGVALFFVISGFVIPISLEKQSTTAFLIARAFRVLPTYAVGFALSAAAVLVVSLYFGRPFPFTMEDIGWHMLPVARAVMSVPNIDGIVWTLEVELIFYVLCASGANLIRRFSPLAFLLPLAALAASIFLPQWFVQDTGIARLVGLFAVYAPYLAFMFTGTAVLFLLRGALGIPAAGGICVLLLLSMWLSLPPELTHLVVPYTLAVAVFVLAFALRDWLRWPSIFHRAADISYPIYVVHPLVGYGILRLSADAGIPPLVCVLIAFVMVTALAAVMHFAVEKPTRRIGKSLAGRIF